jgi:hypothetical protein
MLLFIQRNSSPLFMLRSIALSRNFAASTRRTLTEVRTVGRDKLPSTVLGLLVHSAEHVQRMLVNFS